MSTIPERLDWLWFLGYGLDDEVPNHSVLSKARARWGVAVFKEFFERIVWQCVEAGFVDGRKLFVDASLIDANASNNSVVDTQKLKKYLNKGYKRLENRLDDIEGSKKTPAGSRYISTTDPDASVTRHSGGKSRLRYKTHRAVDEKHENITATKVTPGSVDDGHVLNDMIEAHEKNTQHKLETAVTDSKYGTRDNFLLCHDRKIKANSKGAKRDIKHRQDLSERSFAWSTRYGFKRAKWRRLWRMEIQDSLIAAIQNITILIKRPKHRISKSNIQEIERNKYLKRELCGSFIRSSMTVIAGRLNMALGFG